MRCFFCQGEDDYGKYHGPSDLHGRDVQITWQSALPGGIAVVSRDPDYLKHFRSWAKDHFALASDDVVGMTDVTVVHAQYDKYTASDMCGFPANSTGWLDPGYTNYAVWEGLQHNQRYYYFVGSAAAGFSSVRSFLTPPLATADCFKGAYDGQPCHGIECSKECLDHVAPVKLLLAADIGTNNHLDGTWSADGQGFYAIDAAQVCFERDVLCLGPACMLHILWGSRCYQHSAVGMAGICMSGCV